MSNQNRVNQHGLSRTIPNEVKREVRQRCGFGCVNCGSAIYQYEHVAPPFADAESHDSDCITLLCGGCHDRVTRGVLSKQTIKLKDQNPACKQNGFSFGPFDIGTVNPKITIGVLECEEVETLIRLNGDEIFSVTPPEEEGAPFRINAYLADNEGNEILRIVDNEWFTSTDNWDVEFTGTRITIRSAPRQIALILRSDPPHGLTVERLDMVHKGVKITCHEGHQLQVLTQTGQRLRSGSMKIKGSKIGFDIKSTVTESSIAIGVGGGRIEIGSLQASNDYAPAHPQQPAPRPNLPFRRGVKIGRNEKCPCNSGKKYKKCCGGF